MQRFDVCSDPVVSLDICPKSCGLCPSTTSPAPVLCLDTFGNCGYLKQHFNICADADVAKQSGCGKTCGLCGQSNIGINSSNQNTESANGGDYLKFYRPLELIGIYFEIKRKRHINNTWPRVYKLFFILNSAEHEISLLINMKMPTKAGNFSCSVMFSKKKK